MNNRDIITQAIIDSHPKYELIYNNSNQMGYYYEIYEYQKIYNQDNTNSIHWKIITSFDKYEDALNYFLDLTHQTKYTIISYGRID